ncbi:MAG: hypothetical protein NC429_14480 [Lachnospiraceae bacterium]|nr:hypothetical protein [Lachnospiraceae bacterium]
MSLLEELKDLGVNVEEGLERVMDDQELYEMTLGMFIDSAKDNPVSPEDFDGDDLEALIRRVHMLKGLTGNLGMTPLFTKYNQVLELLRNDQPEAAKAGFEGTLPIQSAIVECIKRHMDMEEKKPD